MKQIIPNVYTFTGLLVGRVYALQDDDGLTLIDTSIANAAPKILRQLEAAGFKPSDVKRILITHAHPDHVGGLKALQEATGAEVYAPALERPVIEDGAKIAIPPKEALKAPWSFMKTPDSRIPHTKVDHTIADGDELPILDGLKVVASPGHALGHVSFWNPSRRMLITGDVFFHLLGLRPPLPMVTVDAAENGRSAHMLADLPAEVVIFGHGNPILTGGQAALRASLHKF